MEFGGPAELLTDRIEEWLEQRTGLVIQDESGDARGELLKIIRDSNGKPGPAGKGKK
jgi:hypothetical protein